MQTLHLLVKFKNEHIMIQNGLLQKYVSEILTIIQIGFRH